MKGIIGRFQLMLGDYIKMIGIFIAAKLCFMLALRSNHPFEGADVWQVVKHGLSLDLSTALYLTIVPFLVMAVSVWWKRTEVLRKVLNGYYAVVAFILALAFVADTSLYPFWGFKLDASCLQFLSTPGDAFASVSIGYIVWRVVIIAVVTTVIAVLMMRHRWHFKVT